MSVDLNKEIQLIPKYRVLSRVSILAETLDYNHKMMNIPAMWRKTKGAGVKVVVLDSGVPAHLDLRIQGGKSFVPNYYTDLNGHAIHVAGILAATANNGMGCAGIAPDCEDYYGAVLGKDGSGSIQGIIDGIRWAVDEVGAHVINMSLGIPGGNPIISELKAVCDYAKKQGVLVVCAAGNENWKVGQPASYDSTVAVAAVNHLKERARFSNFGPRVTVSAGGVDVYSTYLNNAYAKLSGTSMASPALAGVAALIIADALNEGKELTPDEVVEKIKKISYDVGDDGFDELYGHGVPVFIGDDDPDPEPNPEPEPQPEPEPEPEPKPDPKDPSASPCNLGLPAARRFLKATNEALSEDDVSAEQDEVQKLARALGVGLESVRDMLDRLESKGGIPPED